MTIETQRFKTFTKVNADEGTCGIKGDLGEESTNEMKEVLVKET